MNLCLVSREYPPNLMGGIGTYIVNMAQIMARAGHRVSVLTEAHPDAPARGLDHPYRSMDGRLTVYYLPFCTPDWKLDPDAASPEVEALMQRDLAAGFSSIVADALEQLMLRETFDAIEAQEYEAPLLVFQQRCAARAPGDPLRKVPKIVHLHSPSHMIFQHNDDPLSGRWVWARKTHERSSIELADAVLSPSAFLAGQVRDWLELPNDRIHVLPYPIGPLLQYDEDAERIEGLCLFVGRVEPRKGVFEFIEAAIAAARRHPKLRFRFVGGPHFRNGSSSGVETAELIKALIPGPLRDRFDFAGRVPRETLGHEYRQASFVAVPSRWDNYPNTCMEAMSCGTPVLGSDQGGMAEMLEHDKSGYIAEGGESRAELVRNLERGLDFFATRSMDQLEEMGRAARTRILEICSNEVILQRHIDFYGAQNKRTAREKTARLKSSILVALAHLGTHEGRAAEAIQSVQQQEYEAGHKVLFGEKLACLSSIKNHLSGWTVEADAAEGLCGGIPPLKERFLSIIDKSKCDIVYLGSTTDMLQPDTLLKVARLFHNQPEVGFCTTWQSYNHAASSAYRAEVDHLIAPSIFPERWFFRREAIAAAGGFFGNGFFLPDLLRDLAIRMICRGWKSAVIPARLIATVEESGMPLLHPIAFRERRDSIRDVAVAHRNLLAADPLTASERICRFAD